MGQWANLCSVFEIFIGMFADLIETFFYNISVFKEKRLHGNGAMCLAVSFRQMRYLLVME
jgi:hypothetical protein